MNDKRYKLGIWITIAYLLVLGIYAIVQRESVLAMLPNEFGDFLAGVASPLAFLWLVLGYLQQGEELKQNTHALNMQVEELKATVGHQKTLVEETQSQYRFERDKERERRRMERLRGQPSFAVSFSRRLLVGEKTVWECVVLNVGQPAAKVVVNTKEPYHWFKIQPNIAHSIDRGSEFSWRLVIGEVYTPAQGFIVLDYEDSNGEPQKQELEFALVDTGNGKLEIYPNGHPVFVNREGAEWATS